MKRLGHEERNPAEAFTLLEMMVSMGASCVILGGLLLSSMSIQRSVQASMRFAGDYSDQRRLLDYIGRDLRRAVAISRTDSTGVRSLLASGTLNILDASTLVLTLPGYYKSNLPQNTGYDQSLAVVGTDQRLDYGTSTGAAPTVDVVFRKIYVAREKRYCFVRQEDATEEVIVRGAEKLDAQVTIEKGGRFVIVKAAFRSTYSSRQPLVSTFDEILLRNPPLDLHP